MRKKWVPWALSGPPAVRPSIVRLGFAMTGLPVSGSVNARSGMVSPVWPVQAISTASSSSESGAGAWADS